jgi:hypothetical protein
MIDANRIVIQALERAPNIQPAGKESLLAIAARAVHPDVKLSQQGISDALGLHPSLVVAILVTADAAGDTDARRELGLALFQRLKLQAGAPMLSPKGRLMLATWCLERLELMAEVLGRALTDALSLGRAAVAGKKPDADQLQQLAARATKMQTSKVSGVPKGHKEKFGLTDEERFRRHAVQAIRALVQGMVEEGKSVHVCTTVAGEVTRALEAGLGLAAAAGFTLELAEHLEQGIPPEHLIRPPRN